MALPGLNETQPLSPALAGDTNLQDSNDDKSHLYDPVADHLNKVFGQKIEPQSLIPPEHQSAGLEGMMKGMREFLQGKATIGNELEGTANQEEPADSFRAIQEQRLQEELNGSR